MISIICTIKILRLGEISARTNMDGQNNCKVDGKAEEILAF